MKDKSTGSVTEGKTRNIVSNQAPVTFANRLRLLNQINWALVGLRRRRQDVQAIRTIVPKPLRSQGQWVYACTSSAI